MFNSGGMGELLSTEILIIFLLLMERPAEKYVGYCIALLNATHNSPRMFWCGRYLADSWRATLLFPDPNLVGSHTRLKR